MTPKEYRTFASELRQMSAFDVRQNSDPSIQPEPKKRAMAVTELERRRQTRAPPNAIKVPIMGRTVSLILLAAIVAVVVTATAYSKFS